MTTISEDLKGEGSYIIKRIRGQDYLYHLYYEKGEQKWKSLGNVNDLEPKDLPKLAKAKALKASKEASTILEKYFAGSMDKARAKAELLKLLEGA